MKIAKFDPETHTYEGGKLPSVTGVIRAAGLMPPMPEDPFYRERGKILHLVCQLKDEGDLDESTIDPKIRGYYDAYLKFLAEVGYHDEPMIEVPLMNGSYAGTPDRIVTATPRSMWDIKTGEFCHWHRVQAAAYTNLLIEPFSFRRFALYLTEDGKYHVKEFPKTEYMTDLSTFLSALNIYNWRQQHGGANQGS